MHFSFNFVWYIPSNLILSVKNSAGEGGLGFTLNNLIDKIVKRNESYLLTIPNLNHKSHYFLFGSLWKI